MINVAAAFCNQKSSPPEQPWLFEEMATPGGALSPAEKRYKRAVDILLRARRELGDQVEGFIEITACIDAVKAKSRLTDTQREELILYAIEKQGATTVTEISEDIRLAPSIVKQLVEAMITGGVLYAVRKYIPGSDRQYYMLKSARSRTPEVV